MSAWSLEECEQLASVLAEAKRCSDGDLYRSQRGMGRQGALEQRQDLHETACTDAFFGRSDYTCRVSFWN
jgi:hypothetical protein